MKLARFNAVICSGHKGDAVEVPFDPRDRWGLADRALWTGRRGFAVTAKLDGTPFVSVIVARSRKFWLLVPAETARAAGVTAGDSASIEISPQKPAGSNPPTMSH